jgi:hypothetical protein
MDEWNGGGASMTFDKISSHFHHHDAAARWRDGCEMGVLRDDEEQSTWY